MATNPEERLSYLLRWLTQAEQQNLEMPLPTKHELANFAARRNEPMGAQPVRIQLWKDALETINIMADSHRFGDDFTTFDPVFFKYNQRLADHFAAEIQQLKNGGSPAVGSAPTQAPSSVKNWVNKTASYLGGVNKQPAPQAAPAAHPAAAPAAAGVDNIHQLGREYNYDEEEFAEYDDYEDVVLIPGADLRVRAVDGGSLEVTWSLPEEESAPVDLFRVISFDEPFDYNPSEGEQRVVTDGHLWHDTEDLLTANRYFQLWVHQGESVSDALRNQPRMLREEVYVKPIEHIDLTFDGRQISGQWEPTPGTERVDVYIADSTERKLRRQANLLDTGDTHIQGFRQRPEAEGVEYRVAAQRVVKYENLITGQVSDRKSRISDEKSIFVPAEVEPIAIHVQENVVDDTAFDVSWNNPLSGEVRIYRTDQPPADGIQDETPELKQLESFGLPVTGWANNLQRGLESTTVEWPEGWFSLFITPVHVVGEQCKVGQSFSIVRVGDLENPLLHERVHEQLVTFGWPKEASDVVAYMMPPGEGHNFDPLNKPTAEASIDKNLYEDYGGLRLSMTAPADLVLVPSRVYSGRQVEGDPTVLPYRGIEKFQYFIRRDQQGFQYLWVRSMDRIVTDSLDFTLVFNPDRLPLEPQDGEEVDLLQHIHGVPQGSPSLACAYNGVDPNNQSGIEWQINPHYSNYGRGYLRLFFREPQPENKPTRALIDPRIEQLDLYRGGGQ